MNMAKEKTLEDLFHDTLKDIYYAERKILKALPKMARGAQDEKLKAAFQQHKEETEGQVERLQQVFEIIGKRPRAKTCPALTISPFLTGNSANTPPSTVWITLGLPATSICPVAITAPEIYVVAAHPPSSANKQNIAAIAAPVMCQRPVLGSGGA